MRNKHSRGQVSGVALLGAFAGMVVCGLQGAELRAFSLKQAEARARAGRADDELKSLGGINRLVAFVVAPDKQDLVVVGTVVAGLPGIELDDLVVALRSRLVRTNWPLVSIEPEANSLQTRVQRVVFEGGLEGTKYGKDLLDADVALKRYSMGYLDALPAVPTYRHFCAVEAEETARGAGVKVEGTQWLSERGSTEVIKESQGEPVADLTSSGARFWFTPDTSRVSLAGRDGVFCIKELRLEVKAQEDARGTTGTNAMISAAEIYARNFTAHLEELGSVPALLLGRLKALFDLVTIAHGIERLDKGDRPSLDYFLRDHKVAIVKTPATYPLLELCGVVNRSDGRRHLVHLSGGVEVKATVELLKVGDFSQLRQLVFGARPPGEPLAWAVWVADWRFPNVQDLPQAHWEGVSGTPPGCCVSTRTAVLGGVFTPAQLAVLRQDMGAAGLRSAAAGDFKRHATASQALPGMGSGQESSVFKDRAKAIVRTYEQAFAQSGFVPGRAAAAVTGFQSGAANQYVADKQAVQRMIASGNGNTVWYDRAAQRVKIYEQQQGPALKNGVFEGFKGSVAAPEMKGVSMNLTVDESSFTTDKTGTLRRFREDSLKGRKPGELSWPGSR